MTGVLDVDWAAAAAGFEAASPPRRRLLSPQAYGTAIVRHGVDFLARGVRVQPLGPPWGVTVSVAELVGPGALPETQAGYLVIEPGGGLRVVITRPVLVAAGLAMSAEEMRLYHDLQLVGSDVFLEGP